MLLACLKCIFLSKSIIQSKKLYETDTLLTYLEFRYISFNTIFFNRVTNHLCIYFPGGKSLTNKFNLTFSKLWVGTYYFAWHAIYFSGSKILFTSFVSIFCCSAPHASPSHLLFHPFSSGKFKSCHKLFLPYCIEPYFMDRARFGL